MGSHLDEEIYECRSFAAHCARKAAYALTADARADFLDQASNWLQLARSYQFAQLLLDDPAATEPGRQDGAILPASHLGC